MLKLKVSSDTQIVDVRATFHLNPSRLLSPRNSCTILYISSIRTLRQTFGITNFMGVVTLLIEKKISSNKIPKVVVLKQCYS